MRARLLILASAVAMLGWGTVLPYQYAYAAQTRGWGALAAAAASSLFSVGALLAAPVGGRLSDRMSPVLVAVTAKAVAAAGALSLVWADTPLAFLAGMFVFGVGITAASPAQSVLVLRWVGGTDRRRVFAWLFTGQALGMAVGAFVAGYLVDLDRVDGMVPAFALAGVGFLGSAVLISAAGWRAPAQATEPDGIPGSAPAGLGARQAIRLLWAVPELRWTALITATLALGFYAQFESGLPAYALTFLGAQEQTIGLAAAVNCVVIIALQMVVVRVTATRSAPSLLMVVGGIWVLSWLILTAASFAPGIAAALFVTTFAVFAVGETMYAPILNPLTASLAPQGMVGTTLGLFAALQTGVSAIGPLVAGLILGAGYGWLFLALHLAISALAVLGAWRLRALTSSGASAAPHPSTVSEGTALAA
jgi:MFS family permease